MKYYIIENGQQVGPLDIGQLAYTQFTSETLAWKEGMQEWAPAWQIPEFRAILDERQRLAGNSGDDKGYGQTAYGSGVVPPIPPSDDSLNLNQGQPQEKRPRQPKYYLWLKILGGLFIVLLIVLAISNPNKEQHENAIRTEVSKVIDKSSTSGTSDNFFTKGFKVMARMMAGTVLESALDQFFEYHNYIFYSKGTVTIEGKSHTVSYGVFGKVITMNADDMLKALESDNMEIKETETINDEPSTNGSSDEDVTANDGDSESEANSDLQQKIEDKTNQAVDKMKDKVKKKVEDKINQKLDEVTDSSTMEKLIDKIFSLF